MGRKSAKIATKKGANDKAKAQVYTKALKDVFKASKGGSGDLETNFLLRVAVERAKKLNVPKDNIDKAIKKGQGNDGVGYEDVTFEGYAAHGVAIFIEASTNNNTRTVSNVKSYFRKCDGSLGQNGSLQFVFERKAEFAVPSQNLDEEEFTMHMIDAGAEDVEQNEDIFLVTGPMEFFGTIQEKLQEIGVTPDEAQLVRVPLNTKKLEGEELEIVEKLVDLLEEDEDVVSVYHNLA